MSRQLKCASGRCTRSRWRAVAVKPTTVCMSSNGSGSGRDGRRGRRVNGYPKSAPPELYLEDNSAKDPMMPLFDCGKLKPMQGRSQLSNGSRHQSAPGNLLNGDTTMFTNGHLNGHTLRNGNGHKDATNDINGHERAGFNNDELLAFNGHSSHMNGSRKVDAGLMETIYSDDHVTPNKQRWIPQRKRNLEDGAVFGVEMSVRDYELDQYHVVNHAIFINYLDHARHEFLVYVGLDPDEVAQSGHALAIVRQELRYFRPLRSRDNFRATVAVKKFNKIRCVWTEEIWKIGDGNDQPDEIVASAETEGICLDRDYRPIRAPQDLYDRFARFLDGPDVCYRR